MAKGNDKPKAINGASKFKGTTKLDIRDPKGCSVGMRLKKVSNNWLLVSMDSLVECMHDKPFTTHNSD